MKNWVQVALRPIVEILMHATNQNNNILLVADTIVIPHLNGSFVNSSDKDNLRYDEADAEVDVNKRTHTPQCSMHTK